MIVVADTSPLNYLVQINADELLSKLYSKVLIPATVLRELRDNGAPSSVQTWSHRLPAWCEVCELVSVPSNSLAGLDPGERDAIHLAVETGTETILIDESEGRRMAALHRLRVVGTLAVLGLGAQRRLIKFEHALELLEQTNFRISQHLRDQFLDRYRSISGSDSSSRTLK